MTAITWTSSLNGRTYREPVTTTYVPDRMRGCSVPAHLVLENYGRQFVPQSFTYAGRHKPRR